VAIIEELSTDWEPEHYTDCYRERLRRVIEDKRKRRTIHAPKPEKEPDPVSDLMDALEVTLERLRAGEDPRAEKLDQDDDRADGKKTEKKRRRAKSAR
jgi:DNA end-binding protein Ku